MSRIIVSKVIYLSLYFRIITYSTIERRKKRPRQLYHNDMLVPITWRLSIVWKYRALMRIYIAIYVFEPSTPQFLYFGGTKSSWKTETAVSIGLALTKRSFLGTMQKSSTDFLVDENVENGIHHYCEKINADLVARETHGRTGIAHLLAGSVTEGVANHTELPVLSIRISKDKSKEGVIFPD